jgi:hypothetical protein
MGGEGYIPLFWMFNWEGRNPRDNIYTSTNKEERENLYLKLK